MYLEEYDNNFSFDFFDKSSKKLIFSMSFTCVEHKRMKFNSVRVIKAGYMIFASPSERTAAKRCILVLYI